MKRDVLTHLALAVVAYLALLTGYGVLVEPRLVLDERRYTVQLPGLTEEWSGTEVAVFADLQVGMWWHNVGMVEQVVDRVVEADPDALLIGGDFVYSSSPSVSTQVDTVIDLLEPVLESEIPVFAVMGNHDHKVGAVEELTAALEQHGVRVLVNTSAAIPPPPGTDPADPLHIVGIGSAYAGLADPAQALAELSEGAARIVLMHNPTTFDDLPPGSAPLTVAGHTHCGQVALPGSPQWSYVGLTQEEAVVADGFAPPDYGAEGNRMFVTCGVGFSVAPVRINAPPQVVFFELVPDDR